MNLNGFENTIAKMLEEEKLESQLAKDQKWEQEKMKDAVSNELRVEFDLPENI